MKILSFINISNENDLECDSGYIFQRIIAKELHHRGHDYHIAGSNCKSFQNINEPYFYKHYITWGTNRYSSRYNFNFDETKKLIESVKPDIIFNCQIELTSAIRAVLETIKTKNVPLISYCHYPALWDPTIMHSSRPLLDNTLNNGQVGYNILFNILTSLVTANKVLIQSYYARSLLESAINFYKIPYKYKIGIVQPPVDSLLFDKQNHYNTKEPCLSFLYNHRLYKSYGSEEFLSISNKIIERFNLESVVFDSMPNRSG